MMILSDKCKALQTFLIEQHETTYEEFAEYVVEIYNSTFEVLGKEYRVLTDEEADEEAKDYIEDRLWAFKTDFILNHTNINMTKNNYHNATKVLRLIQINLCENANVLIKALIKDFDQFIDDAIQADGRGLYIALYDGIEHESEGFYIYRVN